MAQIHALTPEGRLPTAAVAHVQEIAVPPTWEDLPGKPTSFPSTIPDVQGLTARLAALEYDSGGRDITSSLTGVTGGRLICSRIGSTVWLDFQDFDVRSIDGSFALWNAVLTPGFRPARTVDLPLVDRSTVGRTSTVRVSPTGQIVIYRHTVDILRGLVSFPTLDAPPSSPPGDPA